MDFPIAFLTRNWLLILVVFTVFCLLGYYLGRRLP